MASRLWWTASPSLDCLYLRVARVNHSCSPNSFTVPDFDIRCTVLVAEKDIPAGDEVVIAYSCFNEPTIRFKTWGTVKVYLNLTHGIFCSDGCFCEDTATYRLCQRADEMVSEHEKLAKKASKLDELMALTEELLPILTSIQAVYRSRLVILNRTVRAVLQCPGDGRHLPRAEQFLQEIMTAAKELFNPEGKFWKAYTMMEQHYKEVAAGQAVQSESKEM